MGRANFLAFVVHAVVGLCLNHRLPGNATDKLCTQHSFRAEVVPTLKLYLLQKVLVVVSVLWRESGLSGWTREEERAAKVHFDRLFLQVRVNKMLRNKDEWKLRLAAFQRNEPEMRLLLVRPVTSSSLTSYFDFRAFAFVFIVASRQASPPNKGRRAFLSCAVSHISHLHCITRQMCFDSSATMLKVNLGFCGHVLLQCLVSDCSIRFNIQNTSQWGILCFLLNKFKPSLQSSWQRATGSDWTNTKWDFAELQQ